jgi:uncharacterized protein (DUF2147 family)
MRYLLYWLVFMCLSGSAAAAGALQDLQESAPPADPVGLWLTAKQDTAVRIDRCGDALCGRIAWIHPDEEQVTPKGEPLCGQKVLWGFKHSSVEPELWHGGHIYRADKDKKYSGRIRVEDTDTIKLRGYVGLPFLGKTYKLSRVREAEYPACEAVARIGEVSDE